MRELLLADGQDGPVYLQLADAIRRSIEAERLRPGELLPSTRRLATAWNIHRQTVMTALDELVAEGWIEAERGRGYRVVAHLLVEFTRAAVEGGGTAGERRWDLARPVRRTWPERPELRWSFPSGQPDLRLFPTEEYFAEVREVLRSTPPSELLGYQAPGGCPPIVAALSTWLRRVRGITAGEVVVTHGSQEAIFLLGQLLLKPGEVVAVERLGYPPAWEALRLAGARLVGIEVDGEGIDTDHLETVLRREKVRMIYLTPLHQYPTTVTLSAARRMHLHRLAAQYGVAILEDDYDHEFHYRTRPVAPLKSRDDAGLVLYVSTFSKILYPAARLGFAVVPPALAEPLKSLKRVVSRQNDTLTERAVAAWLTHGGLERHLRRVRRQYEARMGRMASLLDEHGIPYRLPSGGMSIWADFGIDSTRMVSIARAASVAVQDAREFDLDGRPTTFLRLGFASSTPEEIETGLRRLLPQRP